VLLQIVTDAGNVGSDFDAIGEADTSYFAQSGVGLTRSHGLDDGQDAALLGRGIFGRLESQGIEALTKSGTLDLFGDLLTWFAD